MGCSRLLALPQSSASGAAFETLDLIKQHLSLKHRDLKSSLHVTAVSRCELWFCYFLLCYEVRSSSVMSFYFILLSILSPSPVLSQLITPCVLKSLFCPLSCSGCSVSLTLLFCFALMCLPFTSSSVVWFWIFSFVSLHRIPGLPFILFFFFCFFSWITCF